MTPQPPINAPATTTANLADPKAREGYSYHLPDHWMLPDEGLFPILHAAYVSRVVHHLVRGGARTVLEVGCGDGWNCAQFVKAGLSVAGVDWSSGAINFARLFVPEARFEVCDVRDAVFRKHFRDPFDAVAFVEVLEHIPPDDCVTALRSIRERVRPGGLLILTTPSTNVPNTNPHHYRHFDERALRDLFNQAGGYSIERIEGYGDAVFERRHYRLARWVDNRYYRIKPLIRRMEQRYMEFVTDTPPSRCAGFVLVARITDG